MMKDFLFDESGLQGFLYVWLSIRNIFCRFDRRTNFTIYRNYGFLKRVLNRILWIDISDIFSEKIIGTIHLWWVYTWLSILPIVSLPSIKLTINKTVNPIGDVTIDCYGFNIMINYIWVVSLNVSSDIRFYWKVLESIQ